jgi:hypothetical protein
VKEQKLAEFIKSGYPHVKDEGGLAPWALPEHGFNRMVDEAGDDNILRASRPLGLTEGVERLLKIAPDPSAIPPQSWQDAVKQWQPSSQVSSVVAAYLEAIGPVLSQSQSLKPRIDPMVICRSMAVLLLAPFVDQGKTILEEVSAILGGPASAPAGLIKSYAAAVCRGDITTLDKIDRTIVKYGNWQEWANGMQEQALKCRHTPKLVAVTPPPSVDIVGLLATMMKEAHHGSSGDSSEHPDKPVVAQ